MGPEMTAEALIDLLASFDSAGIEVWLDGGWGVDALLGTQTRPHNDVDIILRTADVSRLVDLLSSGGYTVQPGGVPSSFVLAHPAGLEVDVHAITFDENGNGVYRMANGDDWIYPAEGFGGRGTVNGMAVRCLTPAIQVLCHAHGYVPTEKDFGDMECLEERFNVELPPQLNRPSV